jgi:hypothetical protein
LLAWKSKITFLTCDNNYRSKAIGLANKYVSNHGVQRNLEQRLRHNENFRYQISRGKIREELAKDKIDAARERIRANFEAGLM